MDIKEVKPINFLFFRIQTTVNELSNFLHVSKDLYREATRLDLLVCGPVHWHYFGFTGDVNQIFSLEIAVPVDRILQDYDGQFHFKRTAPFKCVSLVHEGNWLTLPGSYAKLMSFIAEKKLSPVAANRELYVNADFQNPEANTTEVQIGIQ